MSIQTTFKPLSRPGRWTPCKWRKIGAKLSYVIPCKDVAWIFGVSTSTVYDWRQEVEW